MSALSSGSVAALRPRLARTVQAAGLVPQLRQRGCARWCTAHHDACAGPCGARKRTQLQADDELIHLRPYQCSQLACYRQPAPPVRAALLRTAKSGLQRTQAWTARSTAASSAVLPLAPNAAAQRARCATHRTATRTRCLFPPCCFAVAASRNCSMCSLRLSEHCRERKRSGRSNAGEERLWYAKILLSC